MKALALLTAIFLIAFALSASAKAESQIVLSTEVGLAIMGPSGLADVGPLIRDELATSITQGVSVGYQVPLLGGRIRGLFGYDDLQDTDGDWGVVTADGGVTRQIIDIQSNAFYLGVEYDFLQVKAGYLYPFVGAGARLQRNKPTHHSALVVDGDGNQFGCVADDAATSGFGWHGLVGLGADIGDWTVRAFYQYTDRGHARVTDGGACPSLGGVPLEPKRDIRLTDHDVRVRLSYSF